MAKDNSATKIKALQTYLDKMRNAATSIPARRKANPEPYLTWVKLEIKRAEDKIEQLRMK